MTKKGEKMRSESGLLKSLLENVAEEASKREEAEEDHDFEDTGSTSSDDEGATMQFDQMKSYVNLQKHRKTIKKSHRRETSIGSEIMMKQITESIRAKFNKQYEDDLQKAYAQC